MTIDFIDPDNKPLPVRPPFSDEELDRVGASLRDWDYSKDSQDPDLLLADMSYLDLLLALLDRDLYGPAAPTPLTSPGPSAPAASGENGFWLIKTICHPI